jgi:hypothetical protein
MPRPDSSPLEESDRVEDPAPCLCHALFGWREQLARSIARNNLAIRSDEIAEAVNRIVFFLVLMRIAGDRGLVNKEILSGLPASGEPYCDLLCLTGEAGDPWDDLDREPRRRGLRMEDLVVEERVLRPILVQALVSDPGCGFSTIPPVGIAGIFSRYLKQTVKRSAAHQATIVDTRDTIQSTGTYEAPDPMIRYMVECALHAAGRNRSKREILPLRIVDPACGSGRVLFAAFSRIAGTNGGSRYTFAEKRQILFESIHGVDADRHAVAAARLLLVIALLEGETVGSLPGDFFAVTQEAFRDLRYTIRHGNALVGPGIAEDDCWMYLSPRERHDLNPFPWQAGFPEITASGGFDAVIGDFPGGPPDQKEWVHQYLQRHYAVYDPAIDRSAYFVEAGFPLLRPGGSLACCMSDSWLRGRTGAPLRDFLKTKEIGEIVDFPGPDGKKNGTGLCVLRLVNRPAGPKKFTATVASPAFTGDLDAHVKLHGFPVDPAMLPDGGWALRDSRREDLLAKLAKAGTPLEDVVMGQVHAGIVVDPAFVIDAATRDQLLRADPRCKFLIRPLVSGTNIGRYRIAAIDRFVLLVSRGWTRAHPASAINPWRWFKRRHPSVARHLRQAGADRKIPDGPEDLWWEGGGCGWCAGSPELRPGIFFPARFRNPAFAYDPGRVIADETVNAIESSSLYLLGLLNSRLIAFVLNGKRNGSEAGPDFFSRDDLVEVPVYTPDLDDPADCARHDRMVLLISRMIGLEKKRESARDEAAALRIQNEIVATGRKIDALVYDLYNLTKEEITIVGAATLS